MKGITAKSKAKALDLTLPVLVVIRFLSRISGIYPCYKTENLFNRDVRMKGITAKSKAKAFDLTLPVGVIRFHPVYPVFIPVTKQRSFEQGWMDESE